MISIGIKTFLIDLPYAHLELTTFLVCEYSFVARARFGMLIGSAYGVD
jgi:hypothetical protein